MSTPSLLKSFIQDPQNTSYEGRDNDECVKLVIRRSLVTVYGWLFTFFLFLIIPLFLIPLLLDLKFEGQKIFSVGFIYCFTAFWYLFSFGFAFQSFLNWYFEVLLITNKKLVDIDHACTNISETTLRNIQDVTSKMVGNWEHVLNIGSIYIQTAAEREEFEFETVDNPSFVRDAISDLISTQRGPHDL
jgi:hypothetical protein